MHVDTQQQQQQPNTIHFQHNFVKIKTKTDWNFPKNGLKFDYVMLRAHNMLWSMWPWLSFGNDVLVNITNWNYGYVCNRRHVCMCVYVQKLVPLDGKILSDVKTYAP